MSKRFIAIAGNIGSGKTTLTKLLSARYQWQPYYEVVNDNPYLADFYSDMRRWSLQLQIFFLSKRFQAHQEITRSSSSAIQDRSIYEDVHIFARTLFDSENMSTRDYQNYLQLYENMVQFLTPPDLVVYVHRSVEGLKERIRERGRHYEQDISDDYLARLNERYDEWISNYKIGKVLTVEADGLDWKHKGEDLEYICQSIESSLEQPELFTTC
ncbi:MAG: deoxynucleoside kinase [Bdellovibrionaceae bacterium]|nr:deoxynucleoside kinase [Bdellovibrionales bacterium]MCB9253123.1 deoxynucleoside kinase [Pseudobdellovibrionaceae bacterium]